MSAVSRISEVEDSLMAPTMEPKDIAVLMYNLAPNLPGIYRFRTGDTAYFARCVSAKDGTSFSFDNPQYKTLSENKLLTSSESTECVGRVVQVFGPPH